MCGLAGFHGRTPHPEATPILQKMNGTLVHRGPDQGGMWFDPASKCGLGHRRLSIIDLTHGQQPMQDCSGRYTLVFNGEIYNHNEVKVELLAKGHPISSRSDTETLVYAYKEWGRDCLKKLRGMFAFAVYDAETGGLFLARDRVGIKPLYYGHVGDTLVFGSECKALLAYPGMDRSMNLQALSDYFSLMYVPAPKTIYRSIRKLPAGHYLERDKDGNERVAAYWDLEFIDASEYGRERDYELAQQDLLNELESSVKIHMESDVPLGAFLSGGIDSSAVVAAMAKYSREPIRTQTIGFSHQGYDEREAAAQTAAHYQTRHHAHEVTADAVSILEKLAWFYDEPFADSSMIPTYYVCAMARKEVTVALSGDGGDESFAGYRRYYFDALENRIRGVLPGWMRRPVFGTMASLYPKADWLPQPLRAKTLLRNLSYSPERGYFTSMAHVHPHMKQRLFTGDVQAQLHGYDSTSVFEDVLKGCHSKDPLSRVQYLDVKTYLVEDILTKVDRASMAVSLEVRVPLLDHRFMELAARMPASWKLQGQTRKRIFRDALRKTLPDFVFNRPKTGFSIPVAEWFRKELRPMGEEVFISPTGLKSTGLFEPKYLESLWKEHLSGMANHSYPLFALMSFGLWHRKFQSAQS